MPDKKISMEMAEKLVAAAKTAKDNAYAPYSGFTVGAAILLEGGNIITGCNVENASYSLTICAERNAMSAALVRGYKQPLAIAIVGDEGRICPPCGACRQFLIEFNPKMTVILEDKAGITTRILEEQLPEYFSGNGIE